MPQGTQPGLTKVVRGDGLAGGLRRYDGSRFTEVIQDGFGCAKQSPIFAAGKAGVAARRARLSRARRRSTPARIEFAIVRKVPSASAHPSPC
jgi:hypothetical protein